MVTVDLSSTTKILKKLPKYMRKRLNYVRIIFTPQASTERVVRLIEFLKPQINRIRVLMEAREIDDADKTILGWIKLF